MYFVYAIRSLKNNHVYIGFTNNLERRIKEHNNGKSKYTKAYIPWILIYYESVCDRADARRLEKHYKTYTGKEKIKKLVKEIEFPKL